MKLIIFFGLLIILLKSKLTRHSDDVLKRQKIYIEAHRGVTNAQKNHNTKEAVLDAISKGIESFETDCWLTKDKKVVLSHDDGIKVKEKKKKKYVFFNESNWKQLKKYMKQKKYKKKKVPLLDDIMKITKNKIFMNLEIKDENDEIWEHIQKLIEKHKYYDQISISSFYFKYYDKIVKYNNDYNRKIVFSFLFRNFNGSNITTENETLIEGPDIYDIDAPNHQITINWIELRNNKEFVESVHSKGMVLGVYFYNEPSDVQYYDLFMIGVDVIITNYPLKVASQLEEFIANDIELEDCL